MQMDNSTTADINKDNLEKKYWAAMRDQDLESAISKVL